MSRPPRLGGADYIGQKLYFLTICCHRRQSVFIHAGIVELVLKQILYAAIARQFALTAYCFMPDLTSFVSLAKQRSGYDFKRECRRPLWQDGYFDRVLRSDEPEITVIRYIVSNPLRARIVETPQEYPFWGSQLYTRAEILDAISRP
jgi:putative transposase